MDLQLRRYFSFNRLYFEVLKNLQTESQKVQFVEAVCLYGFEHKEPSFNDDALKAAWSAVLPDLLFSWEQKTAGAHGGNVSAFARDKSNRKARKAGRGKEEEEGDVQSILFKTPFPEYEEPTENFISYIRKRGLSFVLDAPKPISNNQFRWLYDNAGAVTSTSVLLFVELLIKRNGNFWEEPGNENKSVGDLCQKTLKQATDAFNRWMAATFPNVAALPEERRLTFCQYQELRRRFGRANVLLKISQLNAKKTIYKNIPAFKAVEKFIQGSISKREDSKYHLPVFNDDLKILGDSLFYPGFDASFDLPIDFDIINR